MSEWSIGQLKYIDWLAASKYERKPTTEQLLAKELGVTDRTLRRWKLMPGFKKAVTNRARELLGDDLPEIFGALRREAVKGNYHHIKLVLEITGEYTDKVKVITWQNELIELLKQGSITVEDVLDELGDGIETRQLLESAGVLTIEGRAVEVASEKPTESTNSD